MTLLEIIIAILLLSILVFVHEAGHFFAAKLLKIRVEEFGLGLPPRWFGKKIGETIYSVNKLPIGGFVRLYGEDEQNPDAVKKDRSHAFFAKPSWQRALVVIAGVTMNVLFGWLVYTFLFTQEVTVPTDTVFIESVHENSLAARVGLQKNDVIRELIDESRDRVAIKSPKQLSPEIRERLGERILLVIEREGIAKELPIDLPSTVPEEQGVLGIDITVKVITQQYTLTETPGKAFSHMLDIMKSLTIGIGSLLWKAVTLQKEVRNEVGGVIKIVQLTAQTIEFGRLAVLNLMALLSIQLAIINILPIPALDGGRLLFVVIEGVTGKRVNPRWEQYAHQVGMVILLFLIFLITINDILQLTTG